jgi:hypothetical protein
MMLAVLVAAVIAAAYELKALRMQVFLIQHAIFRCNI